MTKSFGSTSRRSIVLGSAATNISSRVVASTCVEGPCKPRKISGEGRAICLSPLYEVLLVALVELTFRRVGLVHTKDLRREVAEPVDKRSARKVCNQGGFRPIDKTSSN